MAGFLEEGRKGPNAFQTGAKILFGVRGTLTIINIQGASIILIIINI